MISSAYFVSECILHIVIRVKKTYGCSFNKILTEFFLNNNIKPLKTSQEGKREGMFT